MALIQCKECGHEVSDKASMCPNCGCPIEKGNCCIECGQPIPDGVNECPNCGCPTQDNLTHGFESAKKSKNGLIWLISILALSVLLGGGYYLFDKANGAAREKVDKVNIDSLLADGHYTFKGNWESSTHPAQPCKLEFEKKGGKLENCAYTNLKFNTRIPLSGTIQNDTLHFVGDISGKQLVINLKIASNGDILIGEGIDYAHSGDKVKLNLTKNVTDNKGKQTEETSKEEMGEQKTSQESLSTSKFVGTYWLDFGIQEDRFNNNPIVVLEDGRCLIVYETVSGSKDAQLLGNIQYLSNGAFTIKGRETSFGPSLPYNYIDAEGNKHKYTIYEKSYHWRNYDQPVFDINEMKVYRRKSEYINRDVATAYYADIKSKTTSTSLTQ